MDNASAATAPGVEPRVCPFLRAPDTNGVLGVPVGWPDPGNHCVALGDAAPQSLRQQEYACLASAHVDCPRFIRAVEMVGETPHAPVRTGLPVTPAIIAALLVLAGSFALSIGFVVANGGMDLEAAASIPKTSPPEPATSAGPSVAPAIVSHPPAASPDASAEPSPSASNESATAKPSAAPSSRPSPSPEPRSPAPTARPSSDRYALLSPCPDAVDCWIYVIRTGDNLVSIARYFGVPFDEVTRLNPWTTTTQLVAGQELRLPPPTR